MNESRATLQKYAVVGHPIAHSRSPFIHALFAEQTAQPVIYTALDVPPEDFTVRVTAFRDAGGRGLNVTVPLKELAFDFATGHSERARRAGAVNTLRFDVGGCHGDNTDGPGLIRDLEANLAFTVAGRRVLLLGAGGASRGVLGPLLDCRPARLVIANRTPSRARDLAHRFADEGPVEAVALDAIPADGFDLVINATASALTGGTLPLASRHLDAGALCYDMMYGARPTAFLRQARALGAPRVADGRGMLVEQAAESFALWRGIRPDTAPVIKALGDALEASLS